MEIDKNDTTKYGFSLEDLEGKWEEERKWDKQHWFLASFRNFFYFIWYRIPNRLGDMWREAKWGFQRMFRGYDETAGWGLDSYITDISLPVLKKMRKEANGYPVVPGFEEKTSEEQQAEWNRILDLMIRSFTLLKEEDNDYEIHLHSKEWYEENNRSIQEGLILFGTHLRSLWD